MIFKTKKFFLKSTSNIKKNYKLLAAFGYGKSFYILRINEKRLELVNIKNKKITKIKNNPELGDFFNWREVKISKINAEDVVLSCKIHNKKSGLSEVKTFISDDLVNWKVFDPKNRIKNSFSVVDNYSFDKNKIAYYQDENKIKYCKIKYFSLKDKNRETDIIEDSEDKIISAEAYYFKKAIILFYYLCIEDRIFLKVAVMDEKNPSKLIFLNQEPLWCSDNSKISLFPLGIIKKGQQFQLYCKNKEERLFLINLPAIKIKSCFNEFKYIEKNQKYQDKNLFLEKSHKNPIIKPRKNVKWEEKGTFNPAALKLKNKIHLIYRAVGDDYSSTFGYASTKNGIKIEERSSKPVYFPREGFESVKNEKFTFSYPYMSGGGWGGCEDPRLSLVEDRIFMTYTAFNGQMAPGVALTSIKKNDFLNKKWNWETPYLISEPGKIQKNWVIFPEKINGKYAILHSISPEISIDYFDELRAGKVTVKSFYSKNSDGLQWESYLRGVASPPIKTSKGWLLFYHAMDHKHPDQYKLGVMILDLKNPNQIKYRCSNPILEPKEFYENDGKPGVVYVCGSVVNKDKVLVYYGGGDKVSCLASIKMKKLLDALTNREDLLKEIKLENNN
jgi:predicted GH43/DUF377 family glycosyl hydrolase